MVLKGMDPGEKKRIANEKRLKAVKQWKKNQTVKNLQPGNTHIIFDTNNSVSVDEGKQKPKLFGSEDEEDDFKDAFKTRPQFDGPQGQKLLEMSSQFSGRFKLDERFCEDEPERLESQNSEKEKNIEILQSVLGYGISSKSVEKSLPKKRQIRFDPEDENASKYVKVSDISETSELKKRNKKEKRVENDNELSTIPISNERYIEVSSNLKSILNEPAAPFSLSQKFTEVVGVATSEPVLMNVDDEEYEPKAENTNNINDVTLDEKKDTDSNLRQSTRNSQKYTFFIKKGDPRLKEGVEFFQRPKPMDEIREEWNKKRERVLELFRKKEREAKKKRSYSSTSHSDNRRWKKFNKW